MIQDNKCCYYSHVNRESTKLKNNLIKVRDRELGGDGLPDSLAKEH